ncbi:MAG: ABC transporter permease [Microscillaceae bacterium]|nr:ABC transporter permease [Microscillaceae bacterium]
MFDLDKWQEILATMRKNKLRTFLTAFGVFWGIFMLVMLLGAGKGMQNGVERQFGDEAVNSIYLWANKTTIPAYGLKPGRNIRFDNEDLEMLAREIPSLELVEPRNGMWGEYAINYKEKSGGYRVFGTTGGFLSFNGEKLNRGRMLNLLDHVERRKVVILGEKVKEVIFGKEEDPLGKYVEIKGIYFQVVGIFNNTQNQGRNEERAYIPFSTLQATFGQQNWVQMIALTTRPGADPALVQKQLRRVLAKKHRFAENDEEAVYINSNEEQYQRIMNVFWGIRTFVWVVGIMTLIAGIVGVSNIMLIIVKERTKEIGVRKAIGATPWSVISLILQESIVITSISGYFGLLTAAGLLELMRWGIDMVEASGGQLPFFYKPEVDLSVAFAAIIILVIAGALAGLMPALKAARVKPIEALRAD